MAGSDAGGGVLIVSHGYSEPSTQAQIEALSDVIDARLVAPRRQLNPLFANHPTHGSQRGIVRTYRRLRLGRGQYLLLSTTLDLRRLKPSIVHVDYDPWSPVFWQSFLHTRLWSRSSRLVIGSKKNTYRRYRGPLGRLKAALGRIGYARACAVVAASEMTKAMLVREMDVAPEKIAVQTHVGVDVELFRPGRAPGREGEPVVGFCGCFAERKGVVELVRAVECLRERGRSVRLELLGSGPLDGVLAEYAAAVDWLTLRPVVATRAVPDVMRRLDVYALPALRLADHEEHDAPRAAPGDGLRAPRGGVAIRDHPRGASRRRGGSARRAR